MKNLTTEQIDKQILDHAEEMIKLMKLKGFEDNSHIPLNCECIQIWIHDEHIKVEASCQEIETEYRKKN